MNQNSSYNIDIGMGKETVLLFEPTKLLHKHSFIACVVVFSFNHLTAMELQELNLWDCMKRMLRLHRFTFYHTRYGIELHSFAISVMINYRLYMG